MNTGQRLVLLTRYEYEKINFMVTAFNRVAQ